MTIEISNIPKEIFPKIQEAVIKALFKSGIKNIETIVIEDGCSNTFKGFEIVIQ